MIYFKLKNAASYSFRGESGRYYDLMRGQVFGAEDPRDIEFFRTRFQQFEEVSSDGSSIHSGKFSPDAMVPISYSSIKGPVKQRTTYRKDELSHFAHILAPSIIAELEGRREPEIEKSVFVDEKKEIPKGKKVSLSSLSDLDKVSHVLDPSLVSRLKGEQSEPKSEKSKAEESKAEEFKAEDPKAEEPKAEEPKAEEPKAEEPKAEEPKAELKKKKKKKGRPKKQK